MFYVELQWNATTSYNFEIPREFGTDYGICCWYTPQLNFTEILEHQMEHNLTEPDWSNFFLNIKKVRHKKRIFSFFSTFHVTLNNIKLSKIYHTQLI